MDGVISAELERLRIEQDYERYVAVSSPEDEDIDRIEEPLLP